MENITFVKASLQYATSYSKAVDKVARERKYLAAIVGFPEESTVEFVKNIESNNLAQYYAIKDEEVIGWCDVLPKNSFEGMTHVGILGMGILPEYRRYGIGTKLFELAIEHVKKHSNIEKVELEVFKSNINACKFYLKHGFKIEGERINSRKLDGNYDSIILMGKEI